MGIIYGSDAIIRIRFMGLIISASTLLWADVKYHVPTLWCVASPCVGVLVLFSGLHLFGYVLGPGVDVVGEFGGVGQVYLHVGAYA